MSKVNENQIVLFLFYYSMYFCCHTEMKQKHFDSVWKAKMTTTKIKREKT